MENIVTEQTRHKFLFGLIIAQAAYSVAQLIYSGVVLFQSNADGRGVIGVTVAMIFVAYAIVLWGLWRHKRWACLCFIALSAVSALSPEQSRLMNIIDGFDLLIDGALIGLSILDWTSRAGVANSAVVQEA